MNAFAKMINEDVLQMSDGTTVSRNPNDQKITVSCNGDANAFLKALGQFVVHRVEVSRLSTITEVDLLTLVDHPIEELTISDRIKTAHGLELINRLPLLTYFSAQLTHESSRVLIDLSEKTNLRQVCLHGSNLNVEYLVAFLNRSELDALNLSNCECDLNIVLSQSKLNNLRVLQCSSAHLDDRGVECISNITSLEELQIGRNPIGNQFFSISRTLVNLKKLGASETGATIDIGPYLGHLNNLEYLTLSENDLDDGIIPYLFEVPKLAIIHLDNCKISRSGLKQLKAVKKFKVVSCYPFPNWMYDQK